jgi:hypothetical protein
MQMVIHALVCLPELIAMGGQWKSKTQTQTLAMKNE